MARYAIIANGKVEQCIDTDAETAARIGAVLAPGANVGWDYADGAFTASEPPTPVPASVTMRQGRDALILAGLDEAVDTAIDAIPDLIARKRARNAWMNSNEFERHNGFIATLGPQLGLTEAQIDQLFITAATL